MKSGEFLRVNISCLRDFEILADIHPFNLNISSYVLRGKWIPKYHVFDRCIFYHISIYCPIYNEVEVNVTVHEKCVVCV